MSTTKSKHTMRKKPLRLSTITVNLGCGCSRPKLSSIFNPKPKTKIPPYHKHSNFSHSSTSSTTWDKNGISSSSPFSPATMTTPSSSNSSHGQGRARAQARPKPPVAVEKDSSDPYFDFRQSMLQMIVENEIYSKDDLKQLLNCFLQLNAPSLHGVIIRVFTEIWNGFFFSSQPGFYAQPKHYEY